MMRGFYFGGMILGLAIATSPAAATQIFNFTARVDQTGGLAPVNTTVTGRFSYDALLPPTSGGSGDGMAWAYYQNPSIQLAFNFDGTEYSLAAQAAVNSSIEDGGDLYMWASDATIGGNLSIWDPLTTFMVGANLPTAFPALAQGPYTDSNDDDDETAPHGEIVVYEQGSGRNFTATILTVTPADFAAVPEPSVWAMMIIGFGLVGGTMRRRKFTLRYAT